MADVVNTFGMPITLAGPVLVSGLPSYASVISGKLLVTDGNNDKTVVNQYGTAANVTSGSIGVAATYYSSGQFLLKSVQASASAGPCKVQVLVNSGVLATSFFSSINPSVNIEFSDGYLVSGTVGCIIQNNNPNTQDVYANILGLL
jgi:hypothetical protein